MLNTAGVSVGLAGFISSGAGVSAGVTETVGVSGREVGVAVTVGGGGVPVGVTVATGVGVSAEVDAADVGGLVDGTTVVGKGGVSRLTAGVTVSATRPAMGAAD